MNDDDPDMKPKKKTERDIELELGDDYILDLKKRYDLPADEKYDIIPELWEGHNIADFVFPEMEEKLKLLELEEQKLLESGYYDPNLSDEDDETKKIRGLARQIRTKKALMRNEAWMHKSSTKPKVTRIGRKVCLWKMKLCISSY